MVSSTTTTHGHHKRLSVKGDQDEEKPATPHDVYVPAPGSWMASAPPSAAPHGRVVPAPGTVIHMGPELAAPPLDQQPSGPAAGAPLVGLAVPWSVPTGGAPGGAAPPEEEEDQFVLGPQLQVSLPHSFSVAALPPLRSAASADSRPDAPLEATAGATEPSRAERHEDEDEDEDEEDGGLEAGPVQPEEEEEEEAAGQPPASSRGGPGGPTPVEMVLPSGPGADEALLDRYGSMISLAMGPDALPAAPTSARASTPPVDMDEIELAPTPEPLPYAPPAQPSRPRSPAAPAEADGQQQQADAPSGDEEDDLPELPAAGRVGPSQPQVTPLGPADRLRRNPFLDASMGDLAGSASLAGAPSAAEAEAAALDEAPDEPGDPYPYLHMLGAPASPAAATLPDATWAPLGRGAAAPPALLEADQQQQALQPGQPYVPRVPNAEPPPTKEPPPRPVTPPSPGHPEAASPVLSVGSETPALVVPTPSPTPMVMAAPAARPPALGRRSSGRLRPSGSFLSPETSSPPGARPRSGTYRPLASSPLAGGPRTGTTSTDATDGAAGGMTPSASTADLSAKRRQNVQVAVQLNQVIRSRSSNASLVLLNLPPIPCSPVRHPGVGTEYMEYLSTLTEGVGRVLMVRGSGHEVVTIYS
ncbi:cation-chloride cotransporter [Paratrimastix pyriformis]|uniref:Cation-chloride cotransporter n=1 Tax=Paratrimastix pyriformis TaxID=342808 RepID=A0ABQ8UPB8_9EUKA|nr:cation-chloride cotransporter [Paratrimastix pyriformis]